MWKELRRWFGFEQTVERPHPSAWMRQEEQKQMAEVRDRLDRVREQIALLDRRKAERDRTTWTP